MKPKEVRELSPEELEQKRRESRRELFNLHLQQASGQLENPARIRQVRRDLARMNTVLGERARAAK